ncbi:MAG: hypothetical protein ABJ215_16000 [Alphaproteobacteria bacterium]
MQTTTLTGITGKTYTFEICLANGQWRHVAGIYAFVTPEGIPKYIGQTNSFASRKPGPSHDKWAESQRYGATVILAMHLPGSEAVRRTAEKDMIEFYNPPANEQLRTSTSGLTGSTGLFGLGLQGRGKGLLGG